MTVEEAMTNATRLLNAAELELDLVKMQRYNELADSWLATAHLLMEREAAT